jgi:hypothetical protein
MTPTRSADVTGQVELRYAVLGDTPLRTRAGTSLLRPYAPMLVITDTEEY